MSPSTSQHALARRALPDQTRAGRAGWLRHGIAVLAVSVLGVAVAGSVVLAGTAQRTVAAEARPSVRPAVQAAESSRLGSASQPVSRSALRQSLEAFQLESRVAQRANDLISTHRRVQRAAQATAVKARKKDLSHEAAVAKKNAAALKRSAVKRAARRHSIASHPIHAAGKACLPVTHGYHIAATFGQTGIWSRYHTGLDFAAPVGTPIHAPEAGVVTNAGHGRASGWAGHYVAIRHPDGKSTLYAHMSTVSVRVGQHVSACHVIGAIGLTGRTFGPHVHFEVYPAGIEPGDLYKAVNPVPWLHSLGLHP